MIHLFIVVEVIIDVFLRGSSFYCIGNCVKKVFVVELQLFDSDDAFETCILV